MMSKKLGLRLWVVGNTLIASSCYSPATQSGAGSSNTGASSASSAGAAPTVLAAGQVASPVGFGGPGGPFAHPPFNVPPTPLTPAQPSFFQVSCFPSTVALNGRVTCTADTSSMPAGVTQVSWISVSYALNPGPPTVVPTSGSPDVQCDAMAANCTFSGPSFIAPSGIYGVHALGLDATGHTLATSTSPATLTILPVNTFDITCNPFANLAGSVSCSADMAVMPAAVKKISWISASVRTPDQNTVVPTSGSSDVQCNDMASSCTFSGPNFITPAGIFLVHANGLDGNGATVATSNIPVNVSIVCDLAQLFDPSFTTLCAHAGG